MSENDRFATSPTLLGRLANSSNQDAWNEFVRRYTPVVYAWAWQTGLQDSDAADVTQNVLLKLMGHMQSFQYEQSRGSFRGWLKTVTVNAARDCARQLSQRKHNAASLSSIGDEAAWDKLACSIDHEYEVSLLEQAHSIVRQSVQPQTWQAYEMLVLENQKAINVAAKTGLKVAEVYVAKSRVLKKLRATIRDLEALDSGEIP